MPPGASRKPGHVPLEWALSKLGLASRKEARELIRAGRVAVDGRIETDPLRSVVPEAIPVEIDGHPVCRSRSLTGEVAGGDRGGIAGGVPRLAGARKSSCRGVLIWCRLSSEVHSDLHG